MAATYTRDAGNFAAGGESHFEVLDMAASNGIAYWVGFQHATIYRRGSSEPVAMKLRVSELFRREGDAWKLVHRHADMLATPPAPPNEARQ